MTKGLSGKSTVCYGTQEVCQCWGVFIPLAKWTSLGVSNPDACIMWKPSFFYDLYNPLEMGKTFKMLPFWKEPNFVGGKTLAFSTYM